MDSGNSGSIQSSSGGDEEYDSRAESISAFLNPTGHIGPMSNQPQQPPPSHLHHASTTPMFDPLSNFYDPISRPPPLSNPNSLLNLDMVWSKTTRSEPNCTEINSILASSSSVQPFFGSQAQSRAPLTSSSFPENPTPRSAPSDQIQTHVGRNPKKRSRASRRAPTTVLTTDTNNFRAMVQEFTGIPAPPFTSSPFPRGRLDLFPTPTTMRSNPLDTSQPPYLLRPFTQKVQLPAFASSSSSSLSSSFLNSSMVDGIASTSTNNIPSGSASNASTSSTSINYQLSSDQLGLLKQPQSLLMNMQNPILTFQSLLQSPPKYPLANSAILGSKTQGSLEIPSNDSHLKMGVLDEFGLSQGHVNTPLTGLSNLVSSSDRTASRNNDNPTSWCDGVGANDGDQGHLRSVNGNYNLLRNVTNGKLNYSASSSNFHGEKGSENVPTRGEGSDWLKLNSEWKCPKPNFC
ncbi:hypothetical protein F0562_005504 [Nyssa sinensis]|uniref:VQ domain-containing protein n=1 Tax=Nyssa sinensis TaxID=561372 RepID=A0A5J5AM83_9ASTE|nr:hypothetical protein F0562_005504 [Nyssa sinensis]